MAKYHINDKGEAGKCSASKGNCPFGGEAVHFDSLDQARDAYEKEQGTAIPSSSRKAPTQKTSPARRRAEKEAWLKKAVANYKPTYEKVGEQITAKVLSGAAVDGTDLKLLTEAKAQDALMEGFKAYLEANKPVGSYGYSKALEAYREELAKQARKQGEPQDLFDLERVASQASFLSSQP